MNLARFIIGVAVVIGGFAVMATSYQCHREEYYSSIIVLAGACLAIKAIWQSKRIGHWDRNFNETFRGGLETTFRQRRDGN
jgi:hypothetical protein